MVHDVRNSNNAETYKLCTSPWLLKTKHPGCFLKRFASRLPQLSLSRFLPFCTVNLRQVQIRQLVLNQTYTMYKYDLCTVFFLMKSRGNLSIGGFGRVSLKYHYKESRIHEAWRTSSIFHTCSLRDGEWSGRVTQQTYEWYSTCLSWCLEA